MAVRLFIGWPGFGKSLAMQDIAAEAASDGHLCFTVDRAREWTPEATDEEGRSRWRDEPPEILDWPQECDGEELERRLIARRDERDFEKRGAVVRFDFPWNGFTVGELARRIGEVSVFDDEADYTSGKGNWELQHRRAKCPCGVEDCGLEGYSLNPYRDFVHRGRHVPSPIDGVPRVVHLFGAMRRPENVHTDLTGIAEEVMLFRIGGHTTLDRIVKEGWLPEESLEELQDLPKLHYFLHRKGERGAKRGRILGLE